MMALLTLAANIGFYLTKDPNILLALLVFMFCFGALITICD
jgi:hypothetical protein